MILSKDYFKINGVSSDNVGLFVDTPQVPPMAQQRYTEYQIGADEDGVSPDDTFENISYSITAYTFDRPDFDNTDIYKFLANAKTLEISRFEDYYFKVRKIELVQPENAYKGQKIRYQFKFSLAPFKYAVNNPEITLKNGDIVQNTGSRYSKPTFNITGTGDIILTVNGESFTVPSLTSNQNITVDCSRLITYSGSDLIYKTVGKYPFLAVGDNSVSWSGNVNSVKIIKNERWY